jgi:cytochrome c peroxidase
MGTFRWHATCSIHGFEMLGFVSVVVRNPAQLSLKPIKELFKRRNTMLRSGFLAISLGFLLACAGIAHAHAASSSKLTPIQALGKKIFFDEDLSEPAGTSCGTCHNPTAGFADPRFGLPVSQGSIPTRFGDRNAPSITYAAYSPAFHYDPTIRPGIMSGMYLGGFFWDGRAASLEAQVEGPLFNPLEMNNTTKLEVVLKVARSDYAKEFRKVFGGGQLIFLQPEKAFSYMAMAVAAYERSSEVSPFTSKYDYYLAGKVQLTEQEMRGLALFSDASPMGAKCVNCHAMSTDNSSGRPLFTSFGYQNIGTPANMSLPFYNMPVDFNPAGQSYADLGLGAGALKACYTELGRFKIPSLRNVAVTPPYEHNGVFATLKEVVHFNNTRDLLPTCQSGGAPGVDCWPASEIPINVHRHMPPMFGTFGQLGLTDQQEDDIVAFLQTLTDGHMP